jgi:sigma-B regulation protein RsbU (phosphoserine phosphatase)
MLPEINATSRQPAESTVAALGHILRTVAERSNLEYILGEIVRATGASGARIWWRIRAEYPIRHWITVGAGHPHQLGGPTSDGAWAGIWQDRGRILELSWPDLPPHVLDAEIQGKRADVWALVPSGTRARGVAVLWYDGSATGLPLPDKELLREALSAVAAQMWWRERWAQRKLERELLDETGRLLAQSFERDEVLQRIFEILRRVVRYDAGGIFLIDPRAGEVVHTTQVGYDSEALGNLHLKIGEGLVGHVAKTGERVNIPDVSQDPRYVNARAASRSALVVPIEVRERRLGVLILESDRLEAYDANDEWLVKAFAHQLAIALDRAELFSKQIQVRRLSEQLAVARSIQQSFLPQRAPDIEGYDVAGVNFPSEQVGGDYFDFVPIVPGQWGLAIADVSGKGIPAAIIMAGFRASLIAEIRNNYAIRTIFRKVNNVLKEMTPRDNFVTAFYGVLDTHNRVFTFTNAGHNPPLLFRADGHVERLVEGGPLVGVIADATYVERPLWLGKGDLVLLFTDGVTEAQRNGGEEFSEARLVELVKRSRDLSASALCDRIHQEVLSFAANGDPLDDITLVAIRAV